MSDTNNDLSLELQVKELQLIVKEQQDQLTKLQSQKTEVAPQKKKPTTPTEPVTVSGKKYVFNLPSFVLPGTSERLISEEVASDEKLLANILKIEGQGILKPVL